MTQSNTMYEKPVLRKMENTFDLCIVSPQKVESLVLTIFKDRFFYNESDGHILNFFNKPKF